MIAPHGNFRGSGHCRSRDLPFEAHDCQMLDTRTNEWLPRLQANGPKLVSAVLAALILLEIVRLAYPLLASPVKSPQPTVAAARRAARPGLDIQSVVSAHLFGFATATPGAQDPDNAPPSAANLVLAGTIATQNPKRGVAIVSDGGAPSKIYSVGERIGGASLHSVYLDRVILDRNGALETLLLPRQLLPGTRGAAPERLSANANTVKAVESIRHMVQQDPSILDQVMRTVASYDNAAGKLRGFRAYPGRNKQIFNKLGLKSGDLVTAVNGTALDDPQRSQEVFDTIQTSDHVTVTVERNGQKQDITLNIAQVAQQATKDLETGPDPNTSLPAPPPDAQAPAHAAPPPPPPSPNYNNENAND
jgi:general secretion pathway protein C